MKTKTLTKRELDQFLLASDGRLTTLKTGKDREVFFDGSQVWHKACEFCGLQWMKHPLPCPNYHSIDPARCAVRHTYILRSSETVGGVRIVTYCCDLCSIPEFTLTGKHKWGHHPMCATGRHHWTCCGDAHESCGVWCNGCGKKGDWFCLQVQAAFEAVYL